MLTIIKENNLKNILFLFIIITTIISTETKSSSFATTSHHTLIRQTQVFQESPPESKNLFESIQIPISTASCHSSSLTPLPNNKLFVAWYGGTREGARDVKIYGTQIGTNGEISPINILLDRKLLTNEVRRYIRKLGNPVVYAQNERLWLFVTSVSYGGWSGSSINYSYSDDNGATWKTFRRLRTTPLLNISSLVRTPIIQLSNDAFLLPAYCEHSTKYGLALTFNASGVLTRRIKMPIHQNQPALQPSIVPLDSKKGLAFLRTPNKKIGVSHTNDGGQIWKSLPSLPIDNPDSSVVAFKVNSDMLALVGNPKSKGRTMLCLWLCPISDLRQWKLAATIENEPQEEFSYPSVCTLGSTTFLSYTYKRKSIKIINLSSLLSKNNSSKKTDSQEKVNQ